MLDITLESCASSHLTGGINESHVALDPVPPQITELLVIAVAEQRCQHLRRPAEVLLIPLDISDKQLGEGSWILCPKLFSAARIHHVM